MIEVEGLVAFVGKRRVLDGVDFTVPEGESFGLIGANGSGKTTLIRVLTTLHPPSAGDARLQGFSVAHEHEKAKLLVGYVPDRFGAYPRMTAQEYLAFYAGLYGLPRSPDQGVELLELMGLTAVADTYVEHLSRGLQQRLGMARALVHDPPILLVDDNGAIDPRGQADVHRLVRDLCAMGKTVVFATHDLSAVEAMCTQVGVLHRGRMAASGPLDTVRAAAGPGGSLTAAFLHLTEDAEDSEGGE
jgi:ABC-2 type transport system ATP-binding protein